MTENEIEILRIGFRKGLKCCEMHPDNNEFDNEYFEEALKEVELLNGIKTGKQKECGLKHTRNLCSIAMEGIECSVCSKWK